MGWWKRDRGDGASAGAEPGHEAPIELDLGLQKEFEVEMEVERLKGLGLSLYLLAQSENPRGGSLWPKHCRVYVRPGDELRVRAELASAGLL